MNFRQHVLLLAFLILLVFGMSATIVGPCVTSLEETFGVGHGAVGAMFAAGSIGYLIGVRIGGRLARPLGHWWTLWAGTASLGASLLLFGVSPFWPLPIAAHFLCGVGGGVVEPVLVSAIQVLYEEKRRAALNLSQVGFGLGAITGPFIVKFILGARWNWRLAFVFTGAATLGTLALFPRQPIPSGETAAAPRERARAYARNPVLWLMFLVLIFYVGGELGLTSWSSAYFEKTRGATKAQASLAPLFLWLGLLGGRTAMWFIGERHTSRRILFLCSGFSIVFSSAALLSARIETSYLLLMFAGLGLGPIWPTVLDHSAGRLKTTSPAVLSFIMLGGGVGALSQAALGPIAATWSLPAALAVAVALLVGVMVLLLADWLIERQNGMAPEEPRSR